MADRLRIFISSPGDVSEERLRAHLVIQKLARDFARYFRIEAYLWEHEPMLASGHFQDAIETPSASDVVILIVYSRLGTELPERSSVREYRGIDGRAPVTGTEWEYEEALAASRVRGAPDLLAYRKLGDPGASLVDAARRAEQERQWTALEGFWRRHFEDSGVFLAGSSKFTTLEEFDRKLEADLTALIERKIATRTREPDAPEEGSWYRGNPYQGLASYDFEHASIFFGRDAQTRAAVTRLQEAAERGTAFLFIAGGSGSGKSSLARAGVAPALVAPMAVPGVGIWRRVVMRPGDGDDPILALAQALLTTDPGGDVGLAELSSPGMDQQALATHLRASAGDPSFPFRAALNRIAEEARGAGKILAHESARLLLVVDQLEELFAPRVGQAEREAFARILGGLARSGVVWVVATMRSDLWHRVAETRSVLELIQTGARLDLQTPDGAEILEMVRRPAAAAGLKFETDLQSGVALDAIIANAAAEDPGALPLLSVMLHALYLRDIVGREGEGTSDTLTFSTYRALGELRGAIARRADETLEGLRRRDPEAAESFPVVLRALVTVSPDRSTVTARSARLDQFPEGGPEARLIGAFLASDARLFVANSSDGVAEARVAHEALLSHWPRASEQIARDRRDLETRSRLEAMQHRWRDAAAVRERKQSLLTGLNLAEGRDLVRRWRLETSPLGGYVAESQRSATLRRRTLAGAAAALILVFAALAAAASLQWRRAEYQADAARRAEVTERQARLEAEQQRGRAESESRRATAAAAEAEEARGHAVAALEETKRETARTLASQAELSLGDNDIRAALGIAVQAATAEADVLRPGDPSASQPALLKAMAQARQELHIQRTPLGRAMPYGFLGDDTLVYADPKAGLVIVDLLPRPAIRMRVPLPENILPTHLSFLQREKLIALTGVKTFLLVEAETGRVRFQTALDAPITSLDMNEATGVAAVGFGAGFTLVAADANEPSAAIAVPAPRDGVSVGQARFSADGKILWVTYGTDVLRYDVATRSFADAPVGALSPAGFGGDAASLAAVLQTGLVIAVELAPDLLHEGRLFMMGALALSDFDVAARTSRSYDNGDPDFLYAGLSYTDQAGAGWPQELVAVLARMRNPQLDIQLDYVDADGKLLPLESFSLVADDLAGEKPYTCKVSLHVSHLACHYWGKDAEGVVVWRLLGGNHRFERELSQSRATSVAETPDGGATLLTTSGNELAVSAGGRETIAARLDEGSTISAAAGTYVVTHSAKTGRGGVWRFDSGARSAESVAEGASLAPPVLDAGGDRALFIEADSVALDDLKGGKLLWSASGLEGVVAAALPAGPADPVAVLTATGVTLLDPADGKVRQATPLVRAAGSPAAFDTKARALAFVSDGALTVLNLSNGEARRLGDFGADIAALAWSPDGARLIVGRRDGGVLAIDREGKTLWSARSPLGASFSEDNSWPDQPPKGLVLALEQSPDGSRLAVIRQDMPALDLYEGTTGRLLTALTPPWSFGVPARVSLPDDEHVATSWAVHAMTRDRPSTISVHDIPATFDAALTAARETLARLSAIWSPSGAPTEGAGTVE